MCPDYLTVYCARLVSSYCDEDNADSGPYSSIATVLILQHNTQFNSQNTLHRARTVPL